LEIAAVPILNLGYNNDCRFHDSEELFTMIKELCERDFGFVNDVYTGERVQKATFPWNNKLPEKV
jgi:hypothetical protein